MRELENAICRAIVLETTDLLGALRPTGRPRRGTSLAASYPSPRSSDRSIADALEVFDRSQMRAAEAQGINRATLHRKLRKQDGA